MATYQELDTLSQPSEIIQAKLRSGIGTAALAIINEDPGTPNHENRYAWAISVSESFGDRQINAMRLMWLFAQDSNYQNDGDDISDADVQSFVNANLAFIIPGQS